MKSFVMSAVSAGVLLLVTAVASAEVKIDVGHNVGDHATADFKFKEVPSPAKTSAATAAKFSIVDGDKDANSGSVGVLHDGKLPSGEDEAASNFFFAAATDGGRLLIDLGSSINVKQVNTYSWHIDTRGPQVYTLYAADGAAAGFDSKPLKGVDPVKVGWKLIAKVDTRPKTGDAGGQYGVSISDTTGTLGKFRYLLIDAHRAEEEDDFGNTFFSEINVIDADPAAAKPAAPAESAAPVPPPDAKGGRDLREINADFKRLAIEYDKVLPATKDLFDDAKRKDLSPKVIPLLKQLIAIITELNVSDPATTYSYLPKIVEFNSYLAYLGDAEGVKGLAAIAANRDSAKALRGVLAQHQVAWWQAAKDEKAQEKVLAEMQTLADARPKNGNLVSTLESFRDFAAATPALADKAELIIVNTMTGARADSMKEQRAGRILREKSLNNPIELAGQTVEGRNFSTTEYKGKVILVDIWATWCGPCVKELPRVKELYAKYHDQGLEVVGISCDEDGDNLAAYTKKQEMPWVQMWDKTVQTGGNDSWHPLAKKYGFFSIPVLLLIDRNGVLRTFEAREDMETLIPKFLEEKAAPAPEKP